MSGDPITQVSIHGSNIQVVNKGKKKKHEQNSKQQQICMVSLYLPPYIFSELSTVLVFILIVTRNINKRVNG